MQQILLHNMGLSAVIRPKTYDAEKVVSTFLGCFQSNPFRFRQPASIDKMCKYSQFQQVSNQSGIEANRRLPSFSVGSVHWLMCRVL